MEEQRGSTRWGRSRSLVGRGREQQALSDLLSSVRAGSSRALVIHGNPGIGKTALLDRFCEQASGCRVVRMSGVEAEMELPLAALHQLCAPMLEALGALTGPQRHALEVTFGLEAGPAPEHLALGLAVLSLLSEVAAERPLMCIIDDAQWLDRESAQIFAFVARRLVAESVGMVFGSRQPAPELRDLPSIHLGGLSEADSRTLLASVVTASIDKRLLDQFVAETGGNPLALLELPRGLSPTDLAGGFVLPHPGEVTSSIEETFRQRVQRLPEATQRLLLLAAADPLGDPLLLWRAADRLGLHASDGQPAVDDDLIAFGARVRFRHPLVRSVVYRDAPDGARRAAHGALAEATDLVADAERKVWHRAEATAAPDEAIAQELERFADRAEARGGRAAASAFLDKATVLSADPVQRARRALAAAEAEVDAGGFADAAKLLTIAEVGPLDDAARAQLDLVRAKLAFATNRGSHAPPLLLAAARRLQSIDPDLARATFLDALMAASVAAGFGGPDSDVAAVARAAASAPPPSRAPGPADRLLDGLSATYAHGYGSGVALVQEAVAADTTLMPPPEELRWLSVASRAAMHIWDDERALRHSARFVALARELGALTPLTFAVNDHALLLLMSGEPAKAAPVIDEACAIADALGGTMVPWGAMGAAAWRGDEVDALRLIEACRNSATERGEGGAVAGAEWAEAVLHNGFGRHKDALAASQRALEWTSKGALGLDCWVLPELLEASVRTESHDLTAEAIRRIDEIAESGGSTEWCSALRTRALALAATDEQAERLYRESIDRYAATEIVVEQARAQLLFGEWLRRQRRRLDARVHLHTALEVFDGLGLKSFADRARRELGATGQTARRRRDDSRNDLTPQEAQVAQLARQGLSNPEIGARLFISARTVQYHLSKVFVKLGISSRNQLDHVLN